MSRLNNPKYVSEVTVKESFPSSEISCFQPLLNAMIFAQGMEGDNHSCSKTTHVKALNVYRPVALTSILCKYTERVVTTVRESVDTLQFSLFMKQKEELNTTA